MKISTKGRYSLRMMIDLAQHYDENFISLKEISERQGISKKYLEQIIPFLNRSHLLITNRGHMGGYKLAKKPSEITVWEILLCAEGSMCPVSCMEHDPSTCERYENCLTISIWEEFYQLTKDYFSGITLEDLLNKEPCNSL